MNRTELLKQQNDLRAAMQTAHTENDGAKFNELLTKFNDLDKELAKIAEADERSAKLRELEERAEKPQGRVTAPAGAKPQETEVRASKEYEDNMRTWIRSKGKIEARGLSLYNDTEGGYTLAPSRMEQEIIKPVKNISIVRGLAKDELIDGVLSSSGVNLTNITGNSQKGAAVTLTDTASDEDFTFSQRRMMSHPFTHWLKVPNSLIDFSGIDILAFIQNEISERKAVQDDYRFLYGSGVEEPLGLLTASDDGIASGRDYVVTASGVITFSLLLGAYMNQKPQHRVQSSWLFDTTGVKQIMNLKDSQNRPLDMLGLNRGDMPSLFGRPLYETNNIQPTLSSGDFATSQKIGIFGNMKRYAIMESKRVAIKLDPYRLSDEDVTIVYVRTWMDGMPQQSEAFTRLNSNS